MKNINNFTKIGQIINTRGLKGEVKIFPLTENIKRFSDLNSVYIGEELLEVSIEKVSYNKFVYLKFKEFNDIDSVIHLKDKYLYIDDKDRIKLPKNSYFVSDLIGSEVYDNTKLIGNLKEVLSNPVHDIYVVKNKELNKEYLIPAIKEFIVEIDEINKIIKINPIEGMID